MFFTYNLVFPCVMLMSIGILVFCLPPESGEKISLGVTVLLAMTVYQLLIAETIPATSEVIPLIGRCSHGPIYDLDALIIFFFFDIVRFSCNYSLKSNNLILRCKCNVMISVRRLELF
jgi:hypothetical protein